MKKIQCFGCRQTHNNSSDSVTSRRSAIGCWMIALLAAIVFAGSLRLEAAEIAKGTTSRAARQEAIREIPFDKLDEASRTKLWNVVAKPSLYRRLPIEVIDSDPDLYQFLIRYPEVLINVWQLMGVTNVAIKRTGPFTFNASDGAGTTGKMELVYGDAETHVIYAEGTYTGSLLKKKVAGRCVMLLKSAYTLNALGQVSITNRLDVFVQFDNIGTDLMAKTLAPLVGKSADFNFTAATRFIGRLSQESQRNGPGVSRMADKLTNVDPKIRARFAQLSGVVGHQVAMRRAAIQNGATQAARVVPSSTQSRSPAVQQAERPRRGVLRQRR